MGTIFGSQGGGRKRIAAEGKGLEELKVVRIGRGFRLQRLEGE